MIKLTESFVAVGTLTDHMEQELYTTQLSYTGQLCYTHGNNANEWIVRFMAAKDLEALKMVTSIILNTNYYIITINISLI